MATDRPSPSNGPKPEPYEEPPPPYPGVVDTGTQVEPPPYSEPGVPGGFASANLWNPPPYSPCPYPGAGQLPGAVGPLPHPPFPNSDRLLSSVPIYADSLRGNCPNCQTGRLYGSVDVTLIICLVIMAFLLTPFTLCCIPCAFHQECPECNYRTG